MQKILLDGSKISHLAAEPIDFVNLAFIGDAIWAIYCKGLVLSNPENRKLAEIHLKSNHYLNAGYQAAFLRHLSENNILTEHEQNLVRRARNSVMNISGKRSVAHYRHATAFEALVGYLFITNQEKMYLILNEINSFQWNKD